jgi:hypothetical protein
MPEGPDAERGERETEARSDDGKKTRKLLRARDGQEQRSKEQERDFLLKMEEETAGINFFWFLFFCFAFGRERQRHWTDSQHLFQINIDFCWC